MKKILIGSNGGLTGIYLSKVYRKKGQYILYGFDCERQSVGKFFVDKQFYLSKSSNCQFVDELLCLLNEERIDYYLPTHSHEIRTISANEKYIKKNSETKFLVSPYETFEALENKEKMYYSLRENNIPTPKVFSGSPEAFPIIMKRKIGSGSNGVLRIENERIYEAYLETYSSDVVFTELLQGEEYTLDCMFDGEGRLLAFNNRKRIKMMGGGAVVSQNEINLDLKQWVEKISNIWKFKGCVNFQYIKKNGLPYFYDMNLRYPSGGLALTVESGIDIPQMYIDILDGKTLGCDKYQVSDYKKTMYRYFEEKYE